MARREFKYRRRQLSGWRNQGRAKRTTSKDAKSNKLYATYDTEDESMVAIVMTIPNEVLDFVAPAASKLAAS